MSITEKPESRLKNKKKQIRASRGFLLIAALASGLMLSFPAEAQLRIKDIVSVDGVRSNQLVGYGLVVGLNGTGDTLRDSPFTQQSLEGMLERMGVSVRDGKMKTDNVAAVMVTATLPPFARQGTTIDINVSTLGSASSLQGGTLLVTPLNGADGQIYAVAQGPVSVSGFTAKGGGASVTQNIPTGGRIANGGLVEREIDFKLNNLSTVRLALRNPDFTTAQRISQAINKEMAGPIANATDPSTVEIAVPAGYKQNVAGLVTRIETLKVAPDQMAKVIIDEKSGTIVMGEHVRVSTVAIAQGNLTVQISEAPQVSQPAPLGEGETVVVPRTEISVSKDNDKRLAVLENSVNLRELVNGLNALGLGPRDIISILQAIKAAGALHAELEFL